MILYFDKECDYLRSERMPTLPEMLIQPTTLKARLPSTHGGTSILLIGGSKERNSYAYSIREKKYRKLPLLPLGHSITPNICVNFRNKAIFSFKLDWESSIRVASLDLIGIRTVDIGMPQPH